MSDGRRACGNFSSCMLWVFLLLMGKIWLCAVCHHVRNGGAESRCRQVVCSTSSTATIISSSIQLKRGMCKSSQVGRPVRNTITSNSVSTGRWREGSPGASQGGARSPLCPHPHVPRGDERRKRWRVGWFDPRDLQDRWGCKEREGTRRDKSYAVVVLERRRYMTRKELI